MTSHHPDLDALARYPGISAVVTDTPDVVAEQLRRANAAGRLLGMTVAQPREDGQVFVLARLRALPTATRAVPAQSPAAAAAAARRWTGGRVAVLVAMAVAVLALLGVATVLAVQWLLAHLGAVIAALLVAGLVLMKVGKACPGVVAHCRGCKH